MNLQKNISFIVFAIFFIILSIGLFTDTKKIQSPLINKKLPEIVLPDLKSQNMISHNFLPKETFLLNVWASWCQACIVCLLYTSPSPRDKRQSRMPSSA